MLGLLFYSFVSGLCYEWIITVLILGGWLGAGRATRESEGSELSPREQIIVYAVVAVGYYLLFAWLAFSASYARVFLMGPGDSWLWWIPIFLISVGVVWRLTGTEITSCLMNLAAPIAFICFLVWPSVTFGPFSWALQPMGLQWTREESAQLRLAMNSHNKEQEAAKIAEQISTSQIPDSSMITTFRTTLQDALTEAEKVDPVVFSRFDHEGPDQYLQYTDGLRKMINSTDTVLTMLRTEDADPARASNAREEFEDGSRQVDGWTSWAKQHMDNVSVPVFRS